MNNELTNNMVQTSQFTSVNPNFISAQGVADAKRFATGQVNEINAGDIQGFQPIKQPEMQPSTALAGIEGGIESKLTQAKTEFETALQQNLSQAQSQSSETKTGLLDLIRQKVGNLGQRGELEAQQKVPELNKLALDAFNELQTSKQAQMNEIDAINKSNMTDFGRQQALRDVTNKYALQNANLSLSYDIANRNSLAAQQSVNDKITALNEPINEYIKYYEGLLTENADVLSRAEQNALQAKKSEYETLRNQNIEETNAIFEIQQQAADNGADFATIQAIGRAKTRGEAIQAAGQYAGDMLERQIKQEQLSNARLEGQKLKQELDAGEPLTGEFAGIINSAVGLVPGTKQSIVKKNLASAIASENYTTAYAELANAVSDGLTGTNKTKFDDARTDIGVMTGMRNAIQAFEAAGGDMGLLKGSAEKIARNFGQLATDPKFGALAVQLEREFQSYRNNMTGAAFSPEESREYASVNPAGDKNIDLNLSIIDGALNQLTNRVVSTINARIPEAQKIYDLAFTKADIAESQTPVGDTQYVGNVKYVKAEDGLYYPQNQAPTSGNQTTTQSMRPNYQSLNNTNAFSGLGSFFNFK